MVSPRTLRGALVRHFDLNNHPSLSLNAGSTEIGAVAHLTDGEKAAVMPSLVTVHDPTLPVLGGDQPVSAGVTPPAVATLKTDSAKPRLAPARPRALRHMPFWEQFVMYFGVFLGVAASSAVQQFKSGTNVSFNNLTIGTFVIAAVVAIAIIPYVYRKLSVRPDAPFLVRFGLFVQNGVFWQVVFGSIGKSLGP